MGRWTRLVALAGALAMLTLAVPACNSLPTEIGYDCPTSSSADSTFAVGDTVYVDCTRTAP